MSQHIQAFAMLPNAAVLDKRLTHASLRLLAIIAVRRNSGTGWTSVCHATLAADLGLKEGASGNDQVRRLLRALKEYGYLSAITGKGHARSQYRVVYDQPQPNREAERITEGDRGEGPETHTREGAAPHKREGASPHVSEGGTILTYQTLLPNKNMSGESEFDRFWSVYPSKKGKLAAAHKFRIARSRATFAEIMGGLSRYKPDPRFIRHPATWLHGGHWMDEEESSGAAPPEPDDPWGVEKWSATIRDIKMLPFLGVLRPSVGGFDVIRVARAACAEAMIHVTSRPDLEPVAEWLRAGCSLDDIVRAIETADRRPDRPNLRWYTRAVLERKGRA